MRCDQRSKHRYQDVQPDDDEADPCLAVAPQREQRASDEAQWSRDGVAGRTKRNLGARTGSCWRWGGSDDGHWRTRGSRRTYSRSTTKIASSMLRVMTRKSACIRGKS